MSEDEEKEEAEPRQPLRSFAILSDEKGGDPDPDYPVGLFHAPFGARIQRVGLIVITEADNRLVVAVPFTAWHRTVAKRLLPDKALTKASAVSVAFEDRDLEGVARAVPAVKIWIALLAPEFEELVVFDADDSEPPDLWFDPEGPSRLPEASSLIRIADQQFGFHSAASGGEPSVRDRLQILESTLAELTGVLKEIKPDKKASLVAPTAKCPAAPPAAEKELEAPPGLDPDVVRSAQAAGVPMSQIQAMGRMIRKEKPRLGDLPARPSRPHNPLSESEDEVDDAGLDVEAAVQSGDPMQVALLKLTQIANRLTKPKKTQSRLDSILDAGFAGGSDNTSSSSTSSQRSSAALRKLRKALLDHPKLIYEVIEENLSEDFQCHTQMPGTAPVAISARAWLELRSKIGNFQTPLRLLWGIAGVWDCLRNGDADAARARCALLVAQGDQLSIDRGSWVVAGELSLEDSPPFASFATHSLPSETDNPHTKLVDSRWMDLVLHRLSCVDQLMEKKKKLSSKRLPLANPPANSEEVKGAGKKGKGRGDAKGKGKSTSQSGGGHSDPPPAESA